jgi:hypothetical protein
MCRGTQNIKSERSLLNEYSVLCKVLRSWITSKLLRRLALNAERFFMVSSVANERFKNRGEQSSSLLPATSQYGHSWHRSLLGPMAIYLFNVETFFLPFFRCSSFDRLTDGGKVVSLTCRPPFTPQEDSWYSFLLEAESTRGP